MLPILRIVGIVMFAAGIFFTLQATGDIPWPASSFMISNQAWVGRGLVIALVGAAVYLMARPPHQR